MVYKKNVIQDVSTLTTIQKLSIDRLCSQIIKCICYDVCEAKNSGIDELHLDIGIGNLVVKLCEDSVKFRFEPSFVMENSILDALKTGNNPVICDIEKSLLSKINSTYKDLF